MRITSAGNWLAGACILGTAVRGASTNSNTYIRWTDLDNFKSPGVSGYLLSNSSAPQTFNFEAEEGAVVQEVWLLLVAGESRDTKIGHVVVSPTQATGSLGGRFQKRYDLDSFSDSDSDSEPPRLSLRDSSDDDLPVTLEVDMTGSSSITITSLQDIPAGERVLESGSPFNSLYLRVNWVVAALQGQSSSPMFGVTSLKVGDGGFDAIASQFMTSGSAKPEYGPGKRPTDHDAEWSSPSAAASGTGTTASLPTGTAVNPSLASDDPQSADGAANGSNSAKSNKGGLSTGAIVGIAVGVGIGAFLILGLLAWLCIRRRRSDQARDNVLAGQYPGDDQHSPHSIIAMKEANTGVAESPRSPYSDDGNMRPDSMMEHEPSSHHNGSTTGLGMAAAAAAGAGAMHHHEQQQPHHHEQNRSYTPLEEPSPGTALTHDEAQQSTPPPPVPGGPRSLTATPSGQPSRYAHLVEEGMTMDQIRRMEEEEAELDHAIEQAARGGSRMA